MAPDITGQEAAQMLGVSRRTVYRWLDEGRLSYPLTRAAIEGRQLSKRPRGPRRNPQSKRYTIGRHTFRPKHETTQ